MTSISKFIRLDPAVLVETRLETDLSRVQGPHDFVSSLRPRFGIVLASWNEADQLGHATRFGIVVKASASEAEVKWKEVGHQYRPNPTGRRWWRQSKPFFGFAPDVVERYMLEASFAEVFPELEQIEFGSKPVQSSNIPRPSNSPTGGYVYLVRSKYGVKIGKSVDVRSRTRLFSVKLPFPTTVEHYAWFDDYSFAERDLHRRYHSKRLEGEWFDLSMDDVAHIKTLGKSVPVAGL